MRKRMMVLLLVIVLLCNMEAGTINAMEHGESGKQYYTITFDMAGGCTKEGLTNVSRSVEAGTLPSADAAILPVREGYMFQGWKDESGEFYFFNRPIWQDMVLTAAWMPITYRVCFDGNGGTGTAPKEMVFTYDEEKFLPWNSFKREGYTFSGWTIDGTEIYKEGSPVINLTSEKDAVLVLKAVWVIGEYKIRFMPNGGTGTMEDEIFVCGSGGKLSKNKYKRTGYTFTGWNTKSDGTGTWYQNQQKVDALSENAGDEIVLYAMWQGVTYHVIYVGNGADSGSVPGSSHVYGTGSRLNVNNFQRKGYTFAGWTVNAAGTGKIYNDREEVFTLAAKKDKTVALYAKWQPIVYTITYYTNGGSLDKTARKSYTIESVTFTLPRPAREGYDFDGWYLDKNCTKRAGEIKQGSMGDQTLYAKWVKCTAKAKKGSAKLTACKATGTGKVKVKATIKKRVASSDDYYYLVYVNPMNQKIYKMAEKTYKKEKISFVLETAENQGYATSMFGIAVKKAKKYKLISKVSYVKNPEKAAGNKMEYKLPETKKGMQFFNNMDEIVDCGAKHNFLNVPVSMVCIKGTVPYYYNGKTYYFNEMTRYKNIVQECNRRNISVTMQILLNWGESETDLIHPLARVEGAAPYYTWNVFSNPAREKMEAIFCYLGMVFGKKNCYVSNWILGNEVNNPDGWNYRGKMSSKNYFKTYAYAFRALYYAVRSQYSNAHVFICADNLWNVAPANGYSVKYLITSFKKQLDRIQKGLEWNLAYHAYSFPLTYTNVWEGYGITDDINSPYITMKNLNVLTKYIKKTYGSSVRIILSEQGYTSTWGEANQAAALAYSYYIAACNPMIDAFMIRSYWDAPEEAAVGLCMGIKGKEAFWVYKYMDTANSLNYTQKYLKVIKASSWKKIVPGYHKNRITKTYRKV